MKTIVKFGPADHDRPVTEADLAAVHPDGAQQTELTGPFVYRQRQRVGDPDQGDHHGQRQQAVDHVQHLVDLPGDVLLELGFVLQLGVRPFGQRRIERRP